MRITKVLSGAILALAFAVAACGDSTGSGSVTLTAAQASSIWADAFAEYGQAFATGLQNGSVTTSGNTDTFNATATCSGGSGTVKVTGSVSGSGSSETWNLTEAFTACKGTTYTFDGSLTWTGTSTSVHITGTLTLSGAASGSCAVDFSVTINSAGTGGTASGTICGTTINVTT